MWETFVDFDIWHRIMAKIALRDLDLLVGDDTFKIVISLKR